MSLHHQGNVRMKRIRADMGGHIALGGGVAMRIVTSRNLLFIRLVPQDSEEKANSELERYLGLANGGSTIG